MRSSQSWKLPEAMTILRAWGETADTFSFELDATNGGFRFSPGQFNMLYVFGAGEVPISISGDPNDPARLVHTIRRVGPVTRSLGELCAGDQVGVRGPFGAPWPVESAAGRDVVIVAGGIGLAPLRGAIHAFLAGRPRARRVFIAHGARSPAELLYAEEIARWNQADGVRAEVSVDRADSTWRGNTGVVTKLLPHFDFEPKETTAFVCGPEVMMRFAARDLNLAGVPADSIHLSLERNMKCAVGLCGRCQFGPVFVCQDGPVFDQRRALELLSVRER